VQDMIRIITHSKEQVCFVNLFVNFTYTFGSTRYPNIRQNCGNIRRMYK